MRVHSLNFLARKLYRSKALSESPHIQTPDVTNPTERSCWAPWRYFPLSCLLRTRACERRARHGASSSMRRIAASVRPVACAALTRKVARKPRRTDAFLSLDATACRRMSPELVYDVRLSVFELFKRHHFEKDVYSCSHS